MLASPWSFAFNLDRAWPATTNEPTGVPSIKQQFYLTPAAIRLRCASFLPHLQSPEVTSSSASARGTCRSLSSNICVTHLLPVLAKTNRWADRDSTAVLICFRHGLRASELVNLKWEQVDFSRAVLHVNRRKSGTPSVHPLGGRELRALRKLHRASSSPFVFVSERGNPLTVGGFYRMVARAGEAAGIGLKVHPRMFRHACGFVLANAGQDTRSIQAYLGHRNIQHTVRYTELLPNRFRNFWKG